MTAIALILTAASVLAPAGPWQGSTQEVVIPDLVADEVRAIILFEFDGLAEEDLIVERVEQLRDRGKAYIKLQGKRYVVRLRCRKTDFGPQWGLAESDFSGSSTEIKGEDAVEEKTEPAEAEAQPAPTVVAPASAVPDQGYRAFLSGFVTTLREGLSSNYARFYYRDDDFNIAAAEESPEQAVSRLQQQRRRFVTRCGEVARRLAAFESFEVTRVVATGITEPMMADLKTLMPKVREFYNTAVVELLLDGVAGSITLEGVVLVGDEWRIGGIAEFLFPPKPKKQ